MNLLDTNYEFQLTKTKEVYPVSLTEAKRHLRLDNDFRDDDDYITDLITVATTLAENYINKDIAKTLNSLRINDFSDDWVQIYEGNFLNVVDVVDLNDASIGTIKQTNAHYNYFTIDWTSGISSDPLTITFYTGFNDNTTPEIMKQAILIKIGDLYDNSRTSLIYSGLTDSKVFETLLNHYVTLRF